MNFLNKQAIKDLLRQYKIHPFKGLGQNFLISKNVLQKIIKAADLKPGDIILEIGPGIGTLTQALSDKVKKVITIEKDEKMSEILKENLKDFKNIKIIQKDILKIENLKLKIKNYKIVANLPYYITSPVIRKFLEVGNPPSLMVLMVQKEVAQRICAKPPRMSILAVSVQFYARPKIVSYVSKKSFWPQPKVNGAILQIAPLRNSDKKQINADFFFKIVKAGFSSPRKQLINNLSKGLSLSKEKTKKWLKSNKIDPSQRAETLTIQDWKSLAKTFKI